MGNALRYLGMARKAGMVTIGEENSGTVMAAGKGKLLLLAQDASANAEKRALGFQYGHRAPLMRLPWTKEEISQRMGKAGCSMLCFTDLPIASVFAAAMAEEDPAWQETAELLNARKEKAIRRKAAPKKHGSTGKGGTQHGN